MELRTPVLIVGGGPVGLTLAIALGRRGVRCMLIERNPQPQIPPKMERCNARTMEHYRHLGIADAIREAGLPEDGPMNINVSTRCVDPPLVTLRYPTVAEARARSHVDNDGSHPAEPYQIISQYTLEPVLKAAAEAIEGVDVRFAHTLVDFEADEHGVMAQIDGPDGRLTVQADYLVGCDGGRSTVRKALGIRLQGEGGKIDVRQVLFRCEGLMDRLEHGRVRHFHLADRWGTSIVVQDDRDVMAMHTRAPIDSDFVALFEEAVGLHDIEPELLWVGDWKENLLVAERFQQGRVSLAGDAVHLMIPTGGLGMNTGVDDAMNLSWKLAATLEGWGGEGLLPSYELERRPVGIRNVAAAGYAASGVRAWRQLVDPSIRSPAADGVAARARVAEVAAVQQRRCHEMTGIELGVIYLDSPIVVDPGGEHPDPDARSYTPSTWPGARLPHVWLHDGRSLLDTLTGGFVVLGSSSTTTEALASALRDRGVPVTTAAPSDQAVTRLLGAWTYLVRPDGHIAWRGSALDAEAAGAVADTVIGR